MLHPAGFFKFLMWILNKHGIGKLHAQTFCSSDLSIWKKYCDRCTLFMYVHQIRPSQQGSCGTVLPKSTLTELNKWYYGLLVIHRATFDYFDLFGVV